MPLPFVPTAIILATASCRSMSHRKSNRLSKFKTGGSGIVVLDFSPVVTMKMTGQKVRDKLRTLRSYENDFKSQRCSSYAVWSSASNDFLTRHCASLHDQEMEAEVDTANFREKFSIQTPASGALTLTLPTGAKRTFREEVSSLLSQ